MDNLPLVSVCMCTYNRAQIIKNSIDCILNQTYKNIELIIIDDGSTDNTKEVIESYNNDKIRYIQNVHDFISSRNLSFNSAKGKYIAVLDSDDTCDLDRIEKQVNFLELNTDYEICSTDMNYEGYNEIKFDLDYESTISILSNPFGEINYGDYIKYVYPNISLLHGFNTLMFRRKCLKYFKNKIYFYPEFKDGGEDQVFMYNLLALGFKFFRINDIKYYYDRKQDSITVKNKDKEVLFDNVSNQFMTIKEKINNCTKYYYKYNS